MTSHSFFDQDIPQSHTNESLDQNSAKESDSKSDESLETPEHPSENFKDKWLRCVAESENLRRRLEKEKQDQVQYAVFRIAKELLDIAESLKKALAFETSERTSQLYQGVSLTYESLSKIFEKFGILQIPSPLGEKFDPHKHQVMLEKEAADCDSGTVLEVLQDGYTLHDRLLRPCLVVVSKKSSS
jgi:molecular chaperone GrpE